MIGLASFGVLSIVAAFSPTAHALIFSRALLGIAGATLMPSTLSLIRTTFPDAKERTFAIGVWGAMAAAGGGLGPLIGGVLLEHFWWGSVLLINVPIVLLIMGIGQWALRESSNPNPGPIDLPSVALSLAGILGTIAGIKELAIDGFSDYPAWAYLTVGVVALTWFVRRQLRLESPLIDIRMFKNKAFSGAVFSDLISVFGLMGVYFFLGQQFQMVDGDSPLQAGFQLLPAEIAALLGALSASTLIGRRGRRFAIGTGIAVGACGLLGLGLIHVSGLIAVTLAIILVGAGFGISLTGTSDAILASAPPERAGAASAVSETAYELGAALGIALLGTVLGAWYRYKVEVPGAIPADAQAATADSLASVVSSVDSFPADSFPGVADEMLAAARVAFTDGLSFTCVVAAVVCAIGAAVAFRVLPAKEDEKVLVSQH